MSVIRDADIIIAVSGMTLSLISLIRLFNLSYLEKEVRRFFLMVFGIVNGYCFCILLRELIRDRTGYVYAMVSRVVFFSQAFLSSFLTVLIIVFLLYQSREAVPYRSPLLRAAFLLWLVYVCLLIGNQFTGFIFRVDDLNRYTRGPWFWAQMTLPLLIMLIYIMILWQRRKRLSWKLQFAFTCYAVIPILGMLIQSVLFGVHLIALTIVVGTLVLYNQIVSDQMERYIRSVEENAQLKVDILLAQIQPHFMFNSLTTIQHLCRKNPEMAGKAVGDFAAFLRHNMDSLTVDKPIPFQKELKHVQNYLALQKMRFGEELQIVYDLPFMDFCIPTLTVQPIVENAVTYGVRKSESGTGTVTIRSRECSDHIELIVEDDGPGFTQNPTPGNEERSHTGIRNVRERLQRISGGQLVIDSIPGKGTIVTFLLPKGSCLPQ